jgi:hypothetical protein
MMYHHLIKDVHQLVLNTSSLLIMNTANIDFEVRNQVLQYGSLDSRLSQFKSNLFKMTLRERLNRYLDEPIYTFRIEYCCVSESSRDWSILVCDSSGRCIRRFQIWEDLENDTFKLTAGAFHQEVNYDRTAEILKRAQADSQK